MALSGSLECEYSLEGILQEPTSLNGELSLPIGGNGTDDYNALYNKPRINGTELKGDLTTEDLGIQGNGTPEIYIGDGDMPEGCKLQIIPTGEETGVVKDVQINGTSIVANGVANVPMATRQSLGVMSVGAGLVMLPSGQVYVCGSDVNYLAKRTVQRFIASNMIDDTVRIAMTDGKGAEWTAEEKANARLRLGEEWRYIGKVETQEEVARITMNLDENGQPFSLRKVRVKAVNYPNSGDLSTNIRLVFNNKSQDIFHNSTIMTGVKTTETMRICDVIVEKIENILFPTSVYASSNNTSLATVLTPKIDYVYQSDCNALEEYINQIDLYTWTNAIGAGAYMEVWGVDA